MSREGFVAPTFKLLQENDYNASAHKNDQHSDMQLLIHLQKHLKIEPSLSFTSPYDRQSELFSSVWFLGE